MKWTESLSKELGVKSLSKSLGVQIDEHLTSTRDVENKSIKIASAIGDLKRVRQFIDTNTAQKIYETLIQPHFDYWNTVLDGLNVILSDKLQKLKNRAMRAITKSSYNASSNEILSKLGWNEITTRRRKHKAILMFQTFHDLTPPYLHLLFDFGSKGYNLRNIENTLFVPKLRTNYGKRASNYERSRLCNELPQSAYEPYILFINLKEKFITHYLYDT